MKLHGVRAHAQRWLRTLRDAYPQKWERLREGCIVGCSGGADSLALVHVLQRLNIPVEAVIIDHQLQPGSDTIAQQAAQQVQAWGVPARIITIDLGNQDSNGNRTHVNEGAARTARYAALANAAAGRPLLVAHHANDDAEGLLLGLARGSGTASLAGMRPISHHLPGTAFVGRPLLACTRAEIEDYLHYHDVQFWTDPHNSDPQYLRSRIRTELLPLMESILGPGTLQAMARTARELRTDEDTLTALAAAQLPELTANHESPPDDTKLAPTGTKLTCAQLETLLPGVRRRVIKQWLAPHTGPLTHTHITQIEALATNYHGQGAVAVPWHTIEQHNKTGQRLVVNRNGPHIQLTTQPKPSNT